MTGYRPKSGDVLGGRYRLEALIGEGGLCVVWRAADARAGRDVALKWLKPSYVADARLRRRLHREARAVARLEHPQIVRLYDVDEDPAVGPYIAMEFLRGLSLTDRLQRGMSLDELLDATDEILDALAYAHERGVVHRDLKPDNVVVVTGPDGREAIKLLDFGFAWLEDDRDAHISQKNAGIFGTPTYMAPEQITGEGEIGPWTDLYAVCVMLWELITGEPPFSGKTTTAVVVQHVTAPLPSFVPLTGLDLPRGLEAALRRGLDKEPARRYVDAAEMRRALSVIRTGQGSHNEELVDPGAGPLIGRLDVQRWLWDHAVRVCEDGDLHVVLLESQPGMGRTRLCRWLQSTMADGGWMLAGVGAADAEGLRAALRDALGLPPDLDVPPEEALTLALATLELPPSDEVEVIADLLWSTGSLGVYGPGRVAFVLRHLAARRPLLLCLDDLHRASPAFLHALDHALDALGRASAPVLVVLTTALLDLEGDEVPGALPVVDAFVRRNGARLDRHRLEPLGADAMTLFASHVLDLDPAAREAVVEASGGSPLHATHAVYALHEAGILRSTDEGYVTVHAIRHLPDDIVQLTRQRLDRLFEDPESRRERRLAECFALLGDALPVGGLEALATTFETDPGQLEEGLEALVHRGVMVRDAQDRVAFAHPSIAAAMRVDVSIRSDSAILHGRVAEALERLPVVGTGATTADIALQYLAGGCIADAVRMQVVAALEALEHGWPLSASDTLDTAETWLGWIRADRDRHKADLRLARARWARATERYARALIEADAAAGWAEKVGDREIVAHAHRIAGEAALGARELETATHRLRAAEAAGEAAGPRERARRMLASGRLAMARGLLPEAQIRFGQAETRFARLDDPVGAVRCTLAAGELAERSGDSRAAVSRYRDALERAESLGHVGLRGRAMLRVADIQRRLGRDDTAIALYEAAIEALERADCSGSLARALRGLGECRVRRGGGSPIEPLHRAVELFEARGDRPEATACATRLGHAALDQGDSAAAEGFYQRALALFEEHSTDPRVGLLNGFIARAAHRRGRVDQRDRRLQAALRIDATVPLRSVEWPAVLDEIAEGLKREGRLEAAVRLTDRARFIRALMEPDAE